MPANTEKKKSSVNNGGFRKKQNRISNRLDRNKGKNRLHNRVVAFHGKESSFKFHVNASSLVDKMDLISEIKKGLLYEALDDFQRCSGIPLRLLASLLQIPTRTLTRRKKDGRLLPVESDRFVRICRIYAEALELFDGDKEATLEWLSSPQPALGNNTPFDFLETEIGTHEVEAVIGRLEHGVFL